MVRQGKLTGKRLQESRLWQDIRDKLANGDDIPTLARWIREQGVCEDIKTTSLIRQLYRVRDSLPPAEIVGAQSSVHLRDARDRVERGINVLEEMVGLIRIQKRRILIDNKLEEMGGKTFPTLTRDIVAQGQLLVDYKNMLSEIGMFHAQGVDVIEGEIVSSTFSSLSDDDMVMLLRLEESLGQQRV